MNVSIGSQMTQEEIEAYAARMIALAGLNFPGAGARPFDPAMCAQFTTNIICQVVAACGRPIAKAEQEQVDLLKSRMKQDAHEQGGGAVLTMPKGMRAQ
jgi:hypothetical protein